MITLPQKSPRIWPSVVTAPEDTESALWSGSVRSSLVSIHDRVGYIAASRDVVMLAGDNNTDTSSSIFTTIASVSIGSLTVGDAATIFGFYETTSTGVLFGSVVVDDGVGLTLVSGEDALSPISLTGIRLGVVGHQFVASRSAEHFLRIRHRASSGYEGRIYTYSISARIQRAFP